MEIEKFDFEYSNGLNNTISVFSQLLFTSGDELKDIKFIEDIEFTIKHAKSDLENLYDLKPKNREEIFNRLEYEIKETKRLVAEGELFGKEKRIYLLMIFSNIVYNIFKKAIQEVPNFKLKINAPAIVIYDLIKQLKGLCIEDKKQFLPQTNKQLAEFLKSYVEGFENLSISNISTEIGREQNIKKTSIKVKLNN